MADEPTLLTSAATPEANAPPAADAPSTQDVPATEPASWHDTLPEDLKGDATLARYKTPEDAHRALLEARKLASKKAEGIIPPGEDATPEQVEAFQSKLRELRGVPTEDKIAEAYAVAAPEDAPEGYAIDPNFVGAFQKLAHDAGLAPAEFQKMAAGYMQMEVAAMTQTRADAKSRQDKAEAALVKEWRDAGEVPKEKFSQALKVAQALGLVGKDGKDNILGHLGNNTALIKALAENYGLIAEGRLKGGGHDNAGPAYTPQEALAKGKAMMADERYRNPQKRDPDYVREVDAFFEKHGKLMRQR